MKASELFIRPSSIALIMAASLAYKPLDSSEKASLFNIKSNSSSDILSSLASMTFLFAAENHDLDSPAKNAGLDAFFMNIS